MLDKCPTATKYLSDIRRLLHDPPRDHERGDLRERRVSAAERHDARRREAGDERQGGDGDGDGGGEDTGDAGDGGESASVAACAQR